MGKALILADARTVSQINPGIVTTRTLVCRSLFVARSALTTFFPLSRLLLVVLLTGTTTARR
jgi:hypothetical protein